MNGDEDASGPLTTRIGPDEVLQGHFFGRQIRPSEGTWGVPRSGLTGDEFDMVFMRREWPAMPPAGRHVRPWLPPESRAARDRQAEGRQTQSQTVEAHERVPEPARPEGQAQGPARILGEHLQHAAARDRENRPQEPRSSVSATRPRECPWPGAVAPRDATPIRPGRATPVRRTC